MELNKYQKEAVLDDSNVCLVRANVGSGKTTVLIEKIRYLHTEKHVPLENMVVLTFTNKAADEIWERLDNSSVAVPEEPLYYGTFHSIALHMLQEKLPVEELGYTKDFQVCLPEEETEMALQLAGREKLKIKYKNRLRKRLDMFQGGAGKIKDYKDDFLKLAELLSEEKKKENKMSYEDLLKNCTLLLKEHQEIPRPEWIIIDEVQDCDEIQLAMIEQLKEPETKLFAVGDPNQVIYSWRGSVFNIFYRLREKYQGKELSLPVNYRSSGMILKAAGRFQQNGTALEGTREDGEKISIRNHYDPFQEAVYLAERIKDLHKSSVEYDQIAVFYRLQNQSDILEKVFRENQIPCEVSRKKTLQDISVLNWFLHVLRFISNHEDESAGIQALVDKNFGERWTQKKAMKELKELKEGSILLSSSPLLNGMWNYRENGKDYVDILKKLDLDRYLHPSSEEYKENRKYIEEILDKISQRESIREFLNDLVLERPDIKEKSEEKTVKLMTLHGSKGLEFQYVFIIGVNNGLIPLNPGNEAEEEEERRLFYVGMTRAREFLELSYYTSPDGVRVFPGPGRYLSWLPENLTDKGNGAEMRNREEAAEHLQNIKRMLLEERQKLQQGTNNLSDISEEKAFPEIRSPGNIIAEKRVSHPKYGEGTIISEDESMITVRFDDYGEKEMLKAFSQLEEI